MFKVKREIRQAPSTHRERLALKTAVIFNINSYSTTTSPQNPYFNLSNKPYLRLKFKTSLDTAQCISEWNLPAVRAYPALPPP